jgi:hypothetical protein
MELGLRYVNGAEREGLWCGAPPSGMRRCRLDYAATAAMALTPLRYVPAECASPNFSHFRPALLRQGCAGSLRVLITRHIHASAV